MDTFLQLNSEKIASKQSFVGFAYEVLILSIIKTGITFNTLSHNVFVSQRNGFNINRL